VRYARAVLRDERIQQRDVQEAVRIRIASVLGGGYPAGERRLPEDQRQAIFVRDGGRCRLCGAEATEIDHVGAPVDRDINHPDNLQALCSSCHRKKTLAMHRPLRTEEERERAAALKTRIAAQLPLRPCDVPDWADRWRSVAAQRREMLRKREAGKA
jgi:5-methylcytosine-specific restriction endonuclease McrA